MSRKELQGVKNTLKKNHTINSMRTTLKEADYRVCFVNNKGYYRVEHFEKSDIVTKNQIE